MRLSRGVSLLLQASAAIERGSDALPSLAAAGEAHVEDTVFAALFGFPIPMPLQGKPWQDPTPLLAVEPLSTHSDTYSNSQRGEGIPGRDAAWAGEDSTPPRGMCTAASSLSASGSPLGDAMAGIGSK